GCLLRAIEVGYGGGKPGWARGGSRYLLTEEQLALVLEAIALVAEHGQKFVHQYGFDWRSGIWRHRAEAKDQHAAFDPDGWTPVARSARSPKEDFAAYLDAAYALARDLSTREPEFADEPAPEGLDPRTLWFAV